MKRRGIAKVLIFVLAAILIGIVGLAGCTVEQQNEPAFEFNDVESTLVIFAGPDFASEISYPGYLMHISSTAMGKMEGMYWIAA